MSRASYARRKELLRKMQARSDLDLQLITGGALVLDRYSERIYSEIEQSGFDVAETIFNVIEGGNHIAMAKTACLNALEMANILYKNKPDIVLVDGDRFEQLAIAMTAAYLNITLAHIEGGDISGNIDESVRHAITKLSHYHFVTNHDSYQRVLRMGENPDTVFAVGSLDVEYAALVQTPLDSARLNSHGVGDWIDIEKPFLTVVNHPVTSDDSNRSNMLTLFKAVASSGYPTVWFWPNSDAGTDQVAEAIRHFREQGPLAKKNFRFIINLPSEEFIALLRQTSCLVGNSSAGIKECSYLGTPVVNVGSRQTGRLRAENVRDASYQESDISSAISEQVLHGRYASSLIYHNPGTSHKIAEILAKIPLYTQKRFHDA